MKRKAMKRKAETLSERADEVFGECLRVSKGQGSLLRGSNLSRAIATLRAQGINDTLVAVECAHRRLQTEGSVWRIYRWTTGNPNANWGRNVIVCKD